MYIPVVIIGSGIAGMSVAYNLNRKNIKNIIVNKESHFLKSNSAIAPANIRYFDDYKYGIDFYMNQCEGNIDTINSIYSNQHFLIETLNELNIKFKKTPIGVMPESEGKLGGQIILNKLSNYVSNILTNTILIDIKIHEDYIECLLYNEKEKWMNINCGAIVFATGGFGSIFKYNDNAESATGECTYLIQKKTNKLKGMSTIMIHPFGIQNGKRILTGDIVSCLEDIYYKTDKNNFEILNVEPKIFDAIKSNNYHSNEIFSNILNYFYNKDIYLKLRNDFDYNHLKKYNLSEKIIVNNMIHIQPTAHYTSGGVVVDKNFKIEDRIFANGEVIFDGCKGIGRIPGHAFASSIIGGRIISNEIANMDFNEIEKKTDFEIKEKIEKNDESNYLNVKKRFENVLEYVEKMLIQNNNLEYNIKKDLDYVYENTNSIKELMIYYRMNLLNEIVKDIKSK